MEVRWLFRSSRSTLFRSKTHFAIRQGWSKNLMDTPMSTAELGPLCFPFDWRLRQRLPVLHYKNLVLYRKIAMCRLHFQIHKKLNHHILGLLNVYAEYSSLKNCIYCKQSWIKSFQNNLWYPILNVRGFNDIIRKLNIHAPILLRIPSFIRNLIFTNQQVTIMQVIWSAISWILSQFITTRVIFGFFQGISAKFASSHSHNILNIPIIDIQT